MKKLLADYLEIYTMFPKNQYIKREGRKQRFDLIQRYGENYYDGVSMEELCDFLVKHHQEIDATPQFMGKILPTLLQDIRGGGTMALKLLTRCEYIPHEFSYNLYALSTRFGDDMPDYGDAVKLLLEREPDYIPAMQERFSLLSRGIDFTLHELPWAVLLRKDEIDEALVDLDVYRVLGERLGEDLAQVESKIREARFYYLAWQEYITNRDRYENFMQYLEVNGDFGA